MYKIERFLCKLKRYVRSKARPEGCIAEGYKIDECLTFFSMYLTNIETRFNREDRNDDGSSNKDEPVLDIFSKSARPFGDGDYGVIPRKDLDMARQLYDVPEKENSEAESDELHITNNEVYQDMSLESNSIINDTVDILSQLHRDDVEPITLDTNVMELETQREAEVEVGYIEEDSDQEDDTMVEYISDHEENEGYNSTNDDEADSTGDGNNIGL
ncbi:hypothetical protein RND71_008298 [Anisodus tanguticus]|uniref:DUF4218 domain-containing protein n=1 Tax=Anisodus tanguticus TaxID=243964 RepID=A0AAE1SLH3_9SOLA|nr:hypothetical protein RND71_008298 [Anisodus tanguticus]